MTEPQEKQFIDITPEGCKTPEGNKRVHEALQAFEDSHAAVANAATRFMDDWEPLLRSMANRGGNICTEDRDGLNESLDGLAELIRDRHAKQEEFLRAVAGAPPAHAPDWIGAHVEALTQLQYAKADPEGPWALYIYDKDIHGFSLGSGWAAPESEGFHGGRRWFVRKVEYPEEQITINDAKALADKAVQCGYEVRICDGGDMLVFHSKDGKTVYGEGFWEAIQ